MPGGSQDSVACDRFVDGTLVDVLLVGVVVVGRLEPQDRHVCEQLARLAGHEFALVQVLARALQLHAVHLAALRGAVHDVLFVEFVVEQVELEHHQVDRDLVLARLVLLDAGQERLREEEAAHPEADGRAVLLPVAQELHAQLEVHDPGRQRLDAHEAHARLLRPVRGHLVVHDAVAHGLQVFVHYNPASICIFEIAYIVFDPTDQCVVSS